MATGEKSVASSSTADQLTRPAPVFPPTRPEDVFGSLPNRGKSKTLREIETGVLAEARRRQTSE
ncbi:hypothetical protein EOA19_01640 [Mesorhizobium sp. M7A.F.Ca.US.010.02.1.1]|nr:hypothetical protein EOA19_01640 [Mesorhizobium sp. M7A.F.Ca.US.010.02.1.1]